MFSDTLTIIKVINFDQKVHWFDISWSECVLFSKSPIQGSKGKSSKTSYQQKAARFVRQVTTEMGCWPLRVARGKYFLQIFGLQKCVPSIELMNNLFLHKPAAMCFFLFCMLHFFVRCPGHGNLQRCSPKLCLRGWEPEFYKTSGLRRLWIRWALFGSFHPNKMKLNDG